MTTATAGARQSINGSSATAFVFGTSPDILVAAVKTDEEITAIKKSFSSKRKGRAVAKYYENQKTLIDGLLKPIEVVNEEEEDAKLLKVKIAIYGSLLANLLLFCLQLFAAVTSSSLSLFATMVDSFMDLVSNLVLVFANYTSAKRNLQKYPAGKQRFETAGIVVFACVMGALSVQLITEGARALGAGSHSTDLTALNLSCIGIAVAVKIGLYLYCVALRKYPSADILSQDHRNDIVLNLTGIIFSIIGQKVQWWVDPAGGILIALWILFNWGSTAIENIQKFIGETASPLFLNRITYLAMTHHNEILEVDTVRAYSSGAGYFVEVDVVMDPSTPLQKAHDVGESLQTKIEKMESVERAFVHIDYESQHTPEHNKN
ncbi:hypothetical protein HK100_002508 [Physocladia obscura]|uniref:Cation efflux protein cytoplasmic domain-containing protein n=1 Tax=Physocladia obscura TaxID=109957 RepID=A0AAD5XA68_9FUNG|nr:hypothetical protein HK100_002508 [Physocladia obscura]